MVQKIKVLRFILLFLIFILMSAAALTHKGNIETNLLKTLLPQNIINSTNIIPVANKSASVIKVVFEADSEKNVENLKEGFIEKVDNKYFEINKPDTSKLIQTYLKEPTNFLSYKTRELLKGEKYDEVFNQSMETLYNPAGFQLSTMDKDPYLLFDDFLKENRRITNEITEDDGKYYDFLTLKIKDDQGLSPDLVNKKISELVKVQKSLTDKNSQVYLAGSPIHSYYTSQKSIADINLICILSTLMIVFLTYYYFRRIKLLIPVLISISLGMLSGYLGTRLWFNDFQIITMVFSATLMGIGIDYSYHYFFTSKLDKNFVKNLTFSLLTTIIPFVLLYLTGIELLKQIAVFIVFGLIAIYCTVLFIYPCFECPKNEKSLKINTKLYVIVFIILCGLSFWGASKIHFNDTLTALYTPSIKLQKAESLYNKISGNDNIETKLAIVKGDSFNDLLEKEEIITDKLNSENIDYVAISKFIPSIKRQEENYKLVKELYSKNLNNYGEILSFEQILELKKKSFTPVIININDCPYFKDFIMDNNKSIIFIFGDKNLDLDRSISDIVEIKTDIQNYMKDYRTLLIKLLPIVILSLFILLLFIYGFKKSLKILTPPILAILGAVCLTSLICGELNLFSIISVFLILGFTMDYSIFRANSEENTENAVFVSSLTTSFSFLMLALSGFKLLSSMALILFFGILISYISGYIIFLKRD